MRFWRWFRSSQKNQKAKDAPPQKKRGRRLPKRLSRDDVRLLLEQPDTTTWRGLRDRCMLELMYRAGLRVSEVVALRPRDVETDESGNGVVHVWEGKGRTDRTSYFDPASTEEWLSRWDPVRAEKGFTQLQPLFPGPSGKQLSTRMVQVMVRKHRASAGITGRCTPHTLRHTFASELIEEGFSTRAVQELLGHASVATTEIYLHIAASRLAEQVRMRRPEGG